MNRTSTSLVWSGLVSTCQLGLMSQLNTTRSGGSYAEHPRPATFGTVDGVVGDVAADARLKRRLRDPRPAQIVFGRPEVAKAFREDGERPIDRRVHDDLVTDDGRVGCRRLAW